MPYDISILEDEKIIQVTHTDEVDIAELEKARKDAGEMLLEKRFNKILVDTRKVTSTLSMTEHFTFNASHSNMLPVGIKIAIIFHVDYFEYNRFVEEVAQTAGINLKAFVDEQETKNWLLKNN